MKVKKNIMILTNEEIECLKMADKILNEIQDSFPDETELESVDTGEIIMVEEIAMVRGVLSAFYENVEFRERQAETPTFFYIYNVKM